jgi:hypothetical protein
VVEHGDDRRVDPAVPRRGGGAREQPLGRVLDLGLPDLAQLLLRPEVLEDGVEELGLAAVVHVAQSGFREGAGNGVTVDRAVEDFALAPDPDLFRFAAVARARAFVHADSADRPADVPEGGAVSALDESEGHGSRSIKARTSSGVKT